MLNAKELVQKYVINTISWISLVLHVRESPQCYQVVCNLTSSCLVILHIFTECHSSIKSRFTLTTMVRISSRIGQREDVEKLLPSYPNNPVIFSRVTANSKLWVWDLCAVLSKRIDEEWGDLIQRSHAGRFMCQTLPDNC